MILRIIIVAEAGKSAVVDLLTGKLLQPTGNLTITDAREIVRPYLDKFLSVAPPPEQT